jgi:hypothetical protein
MTMPLDQPLAIVLSLDFWSAKRCSSTRTNRGA